jgi:neutral ceramidase
MPQLLAGAARVDITPPLGIRMAGYTVQQDFANAVHSPITATAIFLSGGTADTTTLIIACDLAFIQNPHSDSIRAQVAARLEIDPSHVMINCSHTHLGPMLGERPRIHIRGTAGQLECPMQLKRSAVQTA